MAYNCVTFKPYLGIKDCGTGVGSELLNSLCILLIPLLAVVFVERADRGRVWSVGVASGCLAAGWNGVDVAKLGNALPNKELLVCNKRN